MGFFDALTGMSPDQSAGLLGFGAQLLSASSDPRRPTDFGSAIQAGQQARQQAELLRREREQAAMQAKLFGLKVQDAESDLQNQQMLRDRGQRIAARVGGLPQAGAAGVQDGGEALAQAGAPGLPQTGAGGNKTDAYIQRLLSTAEVYAAEGDIEGANKLYEQAAKLRPEVSGWKEVQQNGKVMYAPFFKDGSNGQPVPLEVAKDLAKVDTGGSTELVNPFTGDTVRSLKNTADPNSVLQANVSMRGQNMTDARARETNQISKAPPGYRFMPDGSLLAIPGGPADLKASKEGVQKTQDASDVLSILNEAEPLLKKSTSSYGGAAWDQLMRVGGGSTTGGEAAAQLKVLQGLLVAKMPKMSGPQSDKDVLLYREMAGQIGDATLPESTRKAAANQLRTLNEKYLGMNPGSSRPDAAAPTAKTVSLADISETARKSGRTTAEVTAALKAKGYTIGGK